jgi:hypothetical protein
MLCMRNYLFLSLFAVSSLFAVMLIMVTPSYAQNPARACLEFTANGIPDEPRICRSDANQLNFVFNNTTPMLFTFTHDGTVIGTPVTTTGSENVFSIRWDPATGTIGEYVAGNNLTGFTVFPAPPGANDVECAAASGIYFAEWFFSPPVPPFNPTLEHDNAPAGTNDCHFTLTLAKSTSVGGEILGIDSTTLFVAGAFANASWIIPIAGVTAAGIVGFALRKRFR